MTRDQPRTVHIACLCDTNNFGDALFPLLAQHRLRPLGYEIQGVSLSGQRARWPDAPPSIGLAHLLAHSPEGAGMLIGGGNIIVARPVTIVEHAIGSLWIAASRFAVAHGRKLIWNAPGLPRPFGRSADSALTRAAMRAADKVCVRDADSRDFLQPDREDVAIVPDTAIDLAALWPAAELAPIFRNLLARKAAPTDRPIAVFHVRPRLAAADFAAIGRLIDTFAAAHGCLPLLLAIGPQVGDDVAARDLARHVTATHLLLDDPRSLKEIAAALAFARCFLGQSLHGAIAAAAYEVPAVLVAPPPARRFRGFLRLRGQAEALAADWPDGFARLARLPHTTLPAALHRALDAHWADTARLLQRDTPPRPAAQAFLQLAASGPTGKFDLPATMRARRQPSRA